MTIETALWLVAALAVVCALAVMVTDSLADARYEQTEKRS